MAKRLRVNFNREIGASQIEENGQAKRHVHIARKPNESYKINCGAKPLMKSLIVELAE